MPADTVTHTCCTAQYITITSFFLSYENITMCLICAISCTYSYHSTACSSILDYATRSAYADVCEHIILNSDSPNSTVSQSSDIGISVLYKPTVSRQLSIVQIKQVRQFN